MYEPNRSNCSLGQKKNQISFHDDGADVGDDVGENEGAAAANIVMIMDGDDG